MTSNENKCGEFVTYKTLHEKLDEVYETIEGNDGLRNRITRVEIWVKVLVAVVPLAAAFGPELGRAFT